MPQCLPLEDGGGSLTEGPLASLGGPWGSHGTEPSAGLPSKLIKEQLHAVQVSGPFVSHCSLLNLGQPGREAPPCPPNKAVFMLPLVFAPWPRVAHGPLVPISCGVSSPVGALEAAGTSRGQVAPGRVPRVQAPPLPSAEELSLRGPVGERGPPAGPSSPRAAGIPRVSVCAGLGAPLGAQEVPFGGLMLVLQVSPVPSCWTPSLAMVCTFSSQ